MNVPAGTGDWFGGWEGTRTVEAHRYCNADGTQGRMVELIERGRPAVMLCHWPGMYCNGSKAGFQAFQQVVLALKSRFESETLWMKVSEIARYWAARETTKLTTTDDVLSIDAAIGCNDFTFEYGRSVAPDRLTLRRGERSTELARVDRVSQLVENSFLNKWGKTICCIALERGSATLASG